MIVAERQGRSMKLHCLLTAAALALMVNAGRADEGEPEPLRPVPVPAATKPTAMVTVVPESPILPAGHKMGPVHAAPQAPGCACAGSRHEKSFGTRWKRFWDWLTYQPLRHPCHTCMWSPMPCCPLPLYSMFECADQCELAPMVAGPCCASCAAHP
jgi:hypothetical protein